MHGCWGSILRYFVFTCNFLFALIGAGFIVLGTYIQVRATHYLDFLDSSYITTPIIVILIGVVIFVIATFACCGACAESSCMIYTYSALLALVLLTQVGAGIAALFLRSQLNGVIEGNMQSSIEHYSAGPQYAGVTESWDFVQQELECCGAENMTDWLSLQQFKNGSLPASCCKLDDSACTSTEAFPSGCFSLVSELFKSNIAIIGATVLIVASLEVITIILACCLGERIYRFKNYEQFQ